MQVAHKSDLFPRFGKAFGVLSSFFFLNQAQLFRPPQFTRVCSQEKSGQKGGAHSRWAYHGVEVL